MSLIVVHLRWDDVGPEQYEELCRALPDGDRRPPGCLLRQRRRQGRAVLGTEVWIDERSAGAFLDSLPTVLGPAGTAEPQQVLFAVPDCFAVGYGVHKNTRRPAASPPVLPTPRSSAEESTGADELERST